MSTRKAIFVTGGASGIGRAIALYFAERDWFVGVGDIDETGMRETLGMMGHGFSYQHKFDVRERADWDEALDGFATAGEHDRIEAGQRGAPIGEDVGHLQRSIRDPDDSLHHHDLGAACVELRHPRPDVRCRHRLRRDVSGVPVVLVPRVEDVAEVGLDR